MSMVWDRFTGLAQGALVWVVSLVVVTLLSANGIGLVPGASLIYGAQHSQSGPTMAAWLTFLSTVLSLVAALIGSAIGQHRAAARVRNEIEANGPHP
jgi:spore maturation protein SpmA